MASDGRPIRRRIVKYKVEDHLDLKYGKWTVLGQGRFNKAGEQYWIVRCDCGEEGERRASHLVHGRSRSCFRCRSNAAKGDKSPHWRGSQNFSGSYLTKIRLSAQNRDIPFDLTLDDLEEAWRKQGGRCAYTGEHLDPETASPDRIDNSIGYVRGNIQFTQARVNYMKHTMSHDEFVKICQKVAAYSQI